MEKVEAGPETGDVIGVGANPLYVVENGREYRLVPLKQRRKLFELLNGKKEESAEKEKKEKTKTKTKVEQKKTEKSVGSKPSSDRSQNGNGIKIEVEPNSEEKEFKTKGVKTNSSEKEFKTKEVKSSSSDQTVKSLNVPYIVEEQEILQNIKIVKSVKNLFLKQNANKK